MAHNKNRKVKELEDKIEELKAEIKAYGTVQTEMERKIHNMMKGIYVDPCKICDTKDKDQEECDFCKNKSFENFHYYLCFTPKNSIFLATRQAIDDYNAKMALKQKKREKALKKLSEVKLE